MKKVKKYVFIKIQPIFDQSYYTFFELKTQVIILFLCISNFTKRCVHNTFFSTEWVHNITIFVQTRRSKSTNEIDCGP